MNKQSKYYDGTKLLSLKDIRGEKPEIFITTTNRSAGKTTYYGRWAVNRFKKYGEKFCLVFRFNYDLADCANKFFKDIGKLFFPNDHMTDKRRVNGTYVELFLNEVSCGYCVALNNADTLKRFSHLLSDTSRMIMDEFQSETNHYCSNELNKLLSLHTSLARGNGEQVRYLPIIMISNAVSLINPYYLALGISDKLTARTKYLKGDGYVLEQGYYSEVAKEQENSGFNRAFANSTYVAYAAQNVYLLDNACFIEKMRGASKYMATLKVEGNYYSAKEFPDQNLIYIDTSFDEYFPVKITCNPQDHEEGFTLIGSSDSVVILLRMYFERGQVRFKNQLAKSALFSILRYSII